MLASSLPACRWVVFAQLSLLVLCFAGTAGTVMAGKESHQSAKLHVKWQCASWSPPSVAANANANAPAAATLVPFVLSIGGCSMSSATGHLAHRLLKELGMDTNITDTGIRTAKGMQVVICA